MKILLVIGSIIVPAMMFFIQRYWRAFRLVFNLLAIIATLVFGNIASLSIYQVIKDNMVLMTNIHSIFLNPFFLISGSYIGIYFIYRLVLLTMEEYLINN